MFGILRPCRHRLGQHLGDAWIAHLCGLCLALRDDHGHLARLVTNYDGLVVSALVEAQSGGSHRDAGPCALRGMRSARVATGPSARLAASVSLVLASAKVADHVVDGDGAFGRAGGRGVGRVVARRWAAQAAETGADLGFDTSVLVSAVLRQQEVEAAAGLGSSVLLVTAPTEEAAGAALAQTALLSGRPGNAEPLREVGRLFGRVAHLVDAVEDVARDRKAGAWNPLLATGVSPAEARRLCDDAVLGVELALREVELTDGALVHALLVHELRRAVGRAFGDEHGHGGHEHPRPGLPGYGEHAPVAHAPAPPGHDSPGHDSPGDQPPTDPPDEPPGGGGGEGGGGVPPEPGSFLWAWPKLTEPPTSRGLLPGCLAVLYQCGTCQTCCREPMPGPWSGKPRNGCSDGCGGGDCLEWCSGCCRCHADCKKGGCDCCDCCSCD
ncbi:MULTISPECIES: DUF5685 family protein [Actinosynnema]|uniref:DUF5685 family protein n=1 Tax=Actinosynnema TaxID=40566 RepID=UPI0020A4916C|nr:DUF5685 family protein [Actinosynnema pretiosum]MCP2094282.1 hypothetical protein [Actinosynnema pretiosum]